MGFGGASAAKVEELIEAAHTITNAAVAVTDARVAVVDAVVDAVKERTDNLPDDPADESALQAAITAAHVTTDALINALELALDLASFKQETAAATDVNGTTWKDLLDKSTITKPTKICGFKVTVGGTWAGNAQVRIVDGSDNKLFPFKASYQEGTDFTTGNQVVFSFPAVVPVADGYKFQFRSTSAADGAGETLQLNNLDVIEVG